MPASGQGSERIIRSERQRKTPASFPAPALFVGDSDEDYCTPLSFGLLKASLIACVCAKFILILRGGSGLVNHFE